MTRRDRQARDKARRVNRDVAKAVTAFGARAVGEVIAGGWGPRAESAAAPAPLRERVLRAFERRAR